MGSISVTVDGHEHTGDAKGIDGKACSRLYVAWQASLFTIDTESGIVLWTQHIPGLGPECIVQGDRIYAYAMGRECHVYAFRTNDGQKLWSVQIALLVADSKARRNEIIALTVSDHMLYILLRDGTITALDSENGEVLRSFSSHTIDENYLGDIELVIHGEVLYDIHQHRLSAIDMRTQCQHWEYSVEAPQVFLARTVVENMLYAVADLDPHGVYVYAFDRESGTLIWSSDLLPDSIFEAPVVRDGHVYCTGATTLFVLDALDGQLLWICPIGLSIYLKPCIIDDQLYLGVPALSANGASHDEEADERIDRNEGVFLALNCIEGSVCWMQEWDSRPGTYAVDQQHMYAGFPQCGEIRAFNRENGLLHWRVRNEQLQDKSIVGFGSSLVVG